MELQALWPVVQQFNNKNGTILTSGKIYIYFQNRTALATTYHDEAGTVVNSNPVLLDNNGRATVFANPAYSYTIVVCDYYGKELFSQDIILHNAIATVENVLITGSDGSVTIDTTELSNGVKYDLSVNTDIIATKQSVDEVKSDLEDLTLVVNNNTIDIDNIQDELTTKKDKQTTLTFDGSATKTIKNITQNANGEMTVEFQDIDLPTNVELISTDDTISISATSVGNDVTYDLSVKDIAGENGANNYAFLKSEMPVNATEMTLEYTDIHTNGIHWNTIDQRLEFSDNIKLIDLNYNIEYEINDANGVSYEDLILYIYCDGQVLEQQTFTIDTSIAKHICKFNKKILDPINLQFMVKVPKAGSVDASIDVNDETFKSITTNGSGDITDVELYSSDGSLLINNTSTGDNVSYNLQLNEQLSAKNYFVTDHSLVHSPDSAGYDDPVWFRTNEPITDLSSNTYRDEGWHTSGIVIPKEMKLLNVKFHFAPQHNSQPRATYRQNSFQIYMDNTSVDGFSLTSDNSYNTDSIERNFLIYNPMSADSVLWLKSTSNDWFGWVNININDETYRSIGTSVSGIPDNYDSLYSTVSANSATWNAGGGSSATSYSAGPNINITDYTISGKDWSNEINAKLDTSAFTLSNSANWDNTYNTVNSNSAAWNNNNSQIINHNQAASGTLVVDNNEYINVSGLDVSGALTVKAMNTSVTNGEPITQCGGTLSFTTSPSAINFVDSNDTALPKLDCIPTTFSGNAYQFTIINGVVACQEIK